MAERPIVSAPLWEAANLSDILKLRHARWVDKLTEADPRDVLNALLESWLVCELPTSQPVLRSYGFEETQVQGPPTSWPVQWWSSGQLAAALIALEESDPCPVHQMLYQAVLNEYSPTASERRRHIRPVRESSILIAPRLRRLGQREAQRLGRSLLAAFASVADQRKRESLYSLQAMLTLCTAAMLCGARSVYGVDHWARLQRPEVLQALGLAQAKVPNAVTLWNMFRTLDVGAFEQAGSCVGAQGDRYPTDRCS